MAGRRWGMGAARVMTKQTFSSVQRLRVYCPLNVFFSKKKGGKLWDARHNGEHKLINVWINLINCRLYKPLTFCVQNSEINYRNQY